MGKQILTVRTTTIESFREWINADEQDTEDKFWVCEENVIGNIKSIERSNIKADFGTAGHSIIEEAPRYKTDTGYVVNSFNFSDTQVQPMLKFRKNHPLMTRELALSKLYSTPSFDLIITGTCDHLEGAHTRDTKFKFSNFDMSDFMDSIQWKIYLDMIGLDIFHYDFFKVDGFQTMEDMPKAKIQEVESLMLRRYNGMEQDIMTTINEFIDFVEFKDLTQYLTVTPAKYKRIVKGDPRLAKLITI